MEWIRKRGMRISRKRIRKDVKIIVLIFLTVVFCISAYTTYASLNEKPKIIEKEITVCNYMHIGRFDYIIYLKNNSLFGATTLGPGSPIFKNITDHINASFSYSFICNKEAKVYGDYELNAEIKTNLWNKSFVIIPKTNFNSSNFKINFPLDIFHFERFVDQIDKELAIRSRNPVLTYKCDVHTIAETGVGTIDESFSHSLTVPLQRNVFSINNLSAQKSGSIKRTEKVIIQSSSVAKRNSLAFTIAIFLSLIAFALITKGEPGTKSKLGKIDETEKVVKWIKRKYGDWIVDSNEIPSTEVIISLKSIEDLMKVAEDLGKPVIHKANKGKHLYCVFDNSVQYKYILSGEKKKI